MAPKNSLNDLFVFTAVYSISKYKKKTLDVQILSKLVI